MGATTDWTDDLHRIDEGFRGLAIAFAAMRDTQEAIDAQVARHARLADGARRKFNFRLAEKHDDAIAALEDRAHRANIASRLSCSIWFDCLSALREAGIYEDGRVDGGLSDPSRDAWYCNEPSCVSVHPDGYFRPELVPAIVARFGF